MWTRCRVWSELICCRHLDILTDVHVVKHYETVRVWINPKISDAKFGPFNRNYSSVIKNDKPCKSSHVTLDSVFMNYNNAILHLKSMNDLYSSFLLLLLIPSSLRMVSSFEIKCERIRNPLNFAALQVFAWLQQSFD